MIIFYQSHLQDPFVLGSKKEGDEKFQSQQYKEAAAIYTLAMNFPIFPFMDTSGIAEKLFRKRATCFFKTVSSYSSEVCNNHLNRISFLVVHNSIAQIVSRNI